MHPDEAVINDYVDQALTPDAQAEVRHHLDACVPCRTLADDLSMLKRSARALGPIEPPARVWDGIQRGIRPQARARVLTKGLAGLAIAATLLLAAAAGFLFRPGSTRTTTTATTAAETSAPTGKGAEAAQTVESELRQAEEHYEKAIKGLEQIANDDKGSLDPATAATLQKNLAVIDQAISESREAVRTQPNNEPAEQSLLENFRTKISVLQDTVALINEMRKGNEAGAARIVSGLNQKGS